MRFNWMAFLTATIVATLQSDLSENPQRSRIWKKREKPRPMRTPTRNGRKPLQLRAARSLF
jgi:hypothetical protein